MQGFLTVVYQHIPVSYTHLTEYRQHHEKEGADGVYHEGGGLEQQFEYLAEEVADALLHEMCIRDSP